MKILFTNSIPNEVATKYNEEFIIPDKKLSSEEIIAKAKGCDAICAISTAIDEHVIKNCPSIKYIGVMGVGYDSIDWQYAKSQNLHLINSPTTVTKPTVEIAVALMLNTMRCIPAFEKKLRDGGFSSGSFPDKGWTTANKTLGIVGFGRIGQQMGRVAKALGMDIIYTSSSNTEKPNDINARLVSFDELLKESDLISLHCPYTKANHHLFTLSEFKQMKNSAFFINTGRGKLHNEDDLVTALKANEIRGAGIDVFEFEPKVNEELKNLPNVCLTPHMGTASYEVRLTMVEETINGLINHFNGKEIHNLVF